MEINYPSFAKFYLVQTIVNNKLILALDSITGILISGNPICSKFFTYLSDLLNDAYAQEVELDNLKNTYFKFKSLDTAPVDDTSVTLLCKSLVTSNLFVMHNCFRSGDEWMDQYGDPLTNTVVLKWATEISRVLLDNEKGQSDD